MARPDTVNHRHAMTPTSVLVTGASGQLGQRVLFHLLDTLNLPPARVIAATRRPDSLAMWAARGVDVRAADFDSKTSLVRAFQGANRMLLISTDADLPGQRVKQHLGAIAAAEAAGVEHLIYTSMPEPRRSLVLFAPDHAESEAALRASRLRSWTVLRNHWYFENIFMVLPGHMARGGKWLSAAGDGKLADIARDDVALAAAVDLAGHTTGTRIYTLSGAESLSTAEHAKLISVATGVPIHVVPVTLDAYVRGMVESGVPEQVARLLASFDLNVAAGHMGNISGDFERITGRKPRSLASWLAANRAGLADCCPPVSSP
jgi:NAD(P)H dehydrogenase (quinone)